MPPKQPVDAQTKSPVDGRTRSPPDGQAKPPVTILVTGFSQFQIDAGPNPSNVITSLLGPLLKTSPAYPTPVDVILYPYPIPAAYKEIRDLIPRLYTGYEKEVDMILHIGMAAEQTQYSLEKCAHRDGYHSIKDVRGETLPETDGESYWTGLPPSLETSLDYDDVFKRWRSNLLNTPEVLPEIDGVRIRTSVDAGHFVCDFIYYSMLAEYQRNRKKVEHSVQKAPVIFLHVPPKNSSEDIKKGFKVVNTLIRSLAESWVSSMRREKE